MRKNIKIASLLSLALIVFGLVGCDKEQEVESPISPDGYPTATFTTDFTGSEISEGDTIYYTVSIDKQTMNPITFSARVVGGTGSDADFDVTSGTIAPYTSEAVIEIIAIRDYVADNDCTVELEIGSFSTGSRYELNANTVNPVLSLSVENYIADGIEMTFGWEYEVAVDTSDMYMSDLHSMESTYDHVDFDIFIADAEGYDPADPWATFNPGAYAATGDTPEELFFPNLGDGSYVIFSELWANSLSDYDAYYDVINEDTVYYDIESKLIPIDVNVTRQGVFNDYTFMQDDSQAMTTVTPGVDDDNYAGGLIDTYVCGVTIANGEYIVTEFDGTEVVRGKIEDFKIKSSRPIYLRK